MVLLLRLGLALTVTVPSVAWAQTVAGDEPSAEAGSGAPQPGGAGKSNPFAPLFEAPQQQATATPSGAPPEHLEQLWEKRRIALSSGDEAAAQQALDAMLELKDLSGWPNMFTYGLALAREAEAALVVPDLERAAALADAAVRLAPARPEGWLARARVAQKSPSGGVLAALRDTTAALTSVLRDPVEQRLRMRSLALALGTAFLIAAGAFAVISLYRHSRAWVSAVQRVLPSWASRAHAGIIVGTVFLAPLVLGAGFVWLLLVWIALSSWHYERRERLGALVVLAVLAGLPFALPYAMGHLSYPGSRAHDAYLAAQDLGARAAAARVLAQPEHTPEELLVLGLRERWSGRLESAAGWLEQASARGLDHPTVLTTLGNIHYALNDRSRAVAAYLEALRREPDHVIALFNVSRVYFSMAEHQKAGDAHRQATALDYERVEKLTQEAKRRGPAFVVNDEIPMGLVQVAGAGDPRVVRAAREVWALLGGPAQPLHYAGPALLVLVLTAGLFWLRRAPGAQAKQPSARDSVAPLQRIRDEIETHRHQMRLLRMKQLATLLVAGGGQLFIGRTLTGLALLTTFLTSILLLLLALDVVPSPVPLAALPHLFSVTASALAAAAAYGVSVWDARREDV